MSHRPTIGIPTQTLQAIDRIPEDLPASWVMNQRYFLACTMVGAVPWMVPLLDEDEATVREIYDRLDGIFLAGGVDMDPASYGEERTEWCGRTDSARDTVELWLARWALEEGKPVFGVCRGMQVMNVAAGGTLIQDCSAQFEKSIKHDYFPGAGWARDHLAHEIRIEPGTTLHAAFGGGTAMVNSMHHQGIRTLGAGLVASSWAPDGLLESLETAGEGFAVGVQWHPEMLIEQDAGTRRLFEEFIAASVRFRDSRTMATA